MWLLPPGLQYFCYSSTNTLGHLSSCPSLREVPASRYAEQAGVSLPRKGRQLLGAVARELWLALWPAGLSPPGPPDPLPLPVSSLLQATRCHGYSTAPSLAVLQPWGLHPDSTGEASRGAQALGQGPASSAEDPTARKHRTTKLSNSPSTAAILPNVPSTGTF